MPRGRSGKKTEDVVMKSAELLGWALGGLEREIAQTRERLASLTAQANTLRARVGKNARSAVQSVVKSAGDPTARGADEGGPEGGRARKRRKMSAEARRRISEMMKKRWAERKRSTS